MKAYQKSEIIEKLMLKENWEDIYVHFVSIGMKKSTIKELKKWLE